MKLADTKLCCECDELVLATLSACPCCTCTAFLSLTRIISPLRPEEIALVRTVEKSYEGSLP